MSLPGIAVRLAALGLLFLVLVPVQALALALGASGPAGRLPVLFHRALLRLFEVRVTVLGALPRDRPALVLANHVSWLDIPVLGAVAPLSFVAKSEVAGWPLIGLLARLQRTVFIDRARRTHTAAVNAQVAARLAAGEAVVLFPEGTTSDGNRVLPFRASLVGAARAALAAPGLDRIDLQPLAVGYVRRDGLPVTRRERPAIAWYGDMELAPHLAAFLRGGPLDAVVVLGDPIPFDAASDRKRATAEAEAAVRRALGEAHRAGALGRPISPKARSA